MEKYIVIEADYNDGDYIAQINEITDEELNKFLGLIQAIKKNKKGHNWETGENADSELTEQYPNFDPYLLKDFNYYVPHGEYGVHTITSIEILKVSNKTKLL